MEIKIILPENLTTEGFENNLIKRGKPIDTEKLDQVLAFIQKYFTKRKGINTMQSSFALSKLMCRRMDDFDFVTNGEFIAAMLMSGYTCKLSKTNSLNAYFNVNKVNESKIKESIMFNFKY